MTTDFPARFPKLLLVPHLDLAVQGIVSIRRCRAIPVFFIPNLSNGIDSSAESRYTVVTSNKSEIRKLIRARRRSLTQTAQNQAARGLLEQLKVLPEFLTAERIAMYIANDGEIDPLNVMQWCWQNKKSCFVPVVFQEFNNSLRFAPVTESTKFHLNKFEIAEPVINESELQDPWQLDLVLMPLVAFDDRGNRVGMGGGFYDTTFEYLKKSLESKPRLVGVAHEIQRVENVEAEHWDIPLSTIVTDQNIVITRTDSN